MEIRNVSYNSTMRAYWFKKSAKWGLAFGVLLLSLAWIGCSTITRPKGLEKQITVEERNQMGIALAYRYATQPQESPCDCSPKKPKDGKPESIKLKEYFRCAYECADDTTPSSTPADAPSAPPVPLSKQAIVRNRILYELMALVDDEYGDFERKIRANRATRDVIFKVFSLGLSGAGPLVQQTTGKILAAIDTAAKGINETINTEGFRDKAAEAIINAMRAERRTIEAGIYKRMSETTANYPLEAGIRDIIIYYNAGSVTSGLAAMQEITSKAAEKAKDDATTNRQSHRELLKKGDLLPQLHAEIEEILKK